MPIAKYIELDDGSTYGLKECPGCKMVKAIQDYGNCKYASDKLRTRCRECTSIKFKRYTSLYNLDDHVKSIWSMSGRPSQISLEMWRATWVAHVIKNGYKCAVTGERFSMESPGLRPSPDQITPKGGYTPDNIRWTTVSYNLARKTYGDERFESMVRAFYENCLA